MKILAPIIIMAALSAATPPANEADIAWVSEGGFCEPETVLPLPDDSLLVSNVCGFQEPGSGFLSLLDASGQPIDWRRVDHLDAPLGMALHNKRIYLLDANRLKIFSWPDFRWLETIDLHTSVANDLAVSNDGQVYITDTGNSEVISLSPGGERVTIHAAAGFPGANGIALDGNYLLVGGKRLWRFDLRTNSVETWGPEWLTDIDGIELESAGVLQVTPVGGPLVRMRDQEVIEILAGEGVSSANHGYSDKLGLALIPTGFDNTVIAIKIPSQ